MDCCIFCPFIEVAVGTKYCKMLFVESNTYGRAITITSLCIKTLKFMIDNHEQVSIKQQMDN